MLMRINATSKLEEAARMAERWIHSICLSNDLSMSNKDEVDMGSKELGMGLPKSQNAHVSFFQSIYI
jgi:hypothetical protein